MRRPTCLATLLTLLLLPTLVRADDVRADPWVRAADAVVKAVETDDKAAVEALARGFEPDPWLVADELCARGAREAAKVFAIAAIGPDTKRLGAYVDAWRASDAQHAAREAFTQARALGDRGQPQQALTQIHELEADGVTGAAMEFLRGMCLRGLRRYPESVAAFERAADAGERLGWMAGARHALVQAAMSVYLTGDYKAVVTTLRRVQSSLGTERNPQRRGQLHGVLAYNLRQLGLLDEAREAFIVALAAYREAGNVPYTSNTLSEMAMLERMRGDLPAARARAKEGLDVAVAGHAQVFVVRALVRLGEIEVGAGNHRRAIQHFEAAAERASATGNEAYLPHVWTGLADAHKSMGAFAEALAVYERIEPHFRASGRVDQYTALLTQIASLHQLMGAYAEARRAYAQAVDLDRKAKLPTAYALAGLANILRLQGDLDGARPLMEEAHAELVRQGDTAGAVRVAIGLATIHREADRLEEAGTMLSALLSETAEDPIWHQRVRTELASIHIRRGDGAAALALLEPLVPSEEDEALFVIHADVLAAMAEAHLLRGDHEQALARTRQTLALRDRAAGRLGAQQGVEVRELWSTESEVGLLAAFALGDVDRLWTMLEESRSGTLLAALGGRAALRSVVLDDELLEAETRAVAAEASALAAYQHARASGARKAIRKARKTLDAARDDAARVVARIQRDAARAASLVHPSLISLADMRKVLAPQEAFVVYTLVRDQAFALVVEANGARIVDLGDAGEIRVLAEAFDPETNPGTEALAKRLLPPLQLGKDVRRVLVSPTGALAYLPFALLVGDLEVAYAPSGTTHAFLAQGRGAAAQKILAVGAPAYSPARKLTPLPATGDEAQTIGDVVLLGAEATETAVHTALGGEARWRAVHFACHGLVDAEHPLRSSLALSDETGGDGTLSVRDLLRARVPADLAVLSACDTARGRVYRSEGVVGLARAFMVAGSSRVLCSLWKVDDDATRALMERFYALWAPDDTDAPRLGAAAALKAAQAHVRAQPKWAAPRYWAAWVLWGPADLRR
ncbi:MAG: CHAT domain-containing protein [Planctomycetota bacterium]|nr:CHAT domain-containing protein [Planctomycetota bacterium]